MARSAQVKHPTVPFAIARVAERIASAWDGVPVDDEQAALIEAHIRPRFEELLEVAESDDQGAIDAAILALQTAEREAFAIGAK